MKYWILWLKLCLCLGQDLQKHNAHHHSNLQIIAWTTFQIFSLS